jgi:NADPH-dependent 2,4-dienoyl-CoA reductase/sulfur reductase-like enzyme
MTRPHDRSAIDGKIALPDEHAELLVIGAGPAGLSAALEGAKQGAKVTLIDENPLEPDLFGLDVPLYFGGRMTGAERHPGQMLEQIVSSNPMFERAVESGVDVRLGTTCWGLYSNGPALQALPVSMVGLADATRSWICGYDRLVLATGARDIAFAFPGWDQPGVMGASGLRCLLDKYNAFSGRRIVVLGSGDLAVSTALAASRRGLEVVALVEVLEAPRSDSRQLAQLTAVGIPVLTGYRPLRAAGGLDGIKQLVICGSDGNEIELNCDTICTAVGLAPVIELLNAAGGRIVNDGSRGGHVPVLQGWATSVENVFVAGDCAGLVSSEGEAEGQGVQAARQSLGKQWSGAPLQRSDAWTYQAAWLDALTRSVDPSLIICQCEAVTRADLLEVRAPRYLGSAARASKSRSLVTLADDGPVNQDQIKRLTRACMGVCQARRCREQVALTLAQAARIPPEEIPLSGYRQPVRPIPLGVIADWAENPNMSAHWEPWFDIRGQWASYADIGTEREFEGPFGGS